MNPSEKRDKAIAAAVTFLVTLLILLVLFFTNMNSVREILAQQSIPEPEDMEDVTFLEPELMTEPAGTDEGEDTDEPPMPLGVPDKADVEETERAEPGRNPEPAPVREPKATQKRSSPVQETPNPMSDVDSKRLKSMDGQFGPKENGSPDGKISSVTGKGKVNAKGYVGGRKFLGCTTGKVAVRSTVTIRVNVRVNADGHVVEAKAVSGPGEYYADCVRWARSARWSAKEGAPTVSGSITFTISPS